MERNANYALVGLISTLLVMGLLIFIVWLSGSQWNKQYDLYDIVFVGPVHGLAQGGEVDFNGIKVGDVTHIALDPKDSRLVIARAKLTPGVPIRVDSYAQLEPQGITGVNYVQITAGTSSKPLLRDTVPEGTVPQLHSEQDALSGLLQGGGSVIQRAVEALNRVNRILSDENIKTITATLSDVQAVTAELRQRKSIIEDAQKTLQSADAAMQQIRELAKSGQTLVGGPANQTVVKLGNAATEIESATKELHVMIGKLEQPTSDFATTGLPQLTETMVSLQRTTEDLDRMIADMHASPRGFIAKTPAKEVEVKP